MLFRPVMKLGPDLKDEHIDNARRTGTIGKSLLIAVLSPRAFADTADYPTFLHGFVCGRFRRLHPRYRPAFRNNPPSASSRCDQHDLDAAIRSPIRQCSILRFLRLMHHLVADPFAPAITRSAARPAPARKPAACTIPPPPEHCRHNRWHRFPWRSRARRARRRRSPGSSSLPS